MYREFDETVFYDICHHPQKSDKRLMADTGLSCSGGYRFYVCTVDGVSDYMNEV